jgi:hypothetical protein
MFVILQKKNHKSDAEKKVSCKVRENKKAINNRPMVAE